MTEDGVELPLQGLAATVAAGVDDREQRADLVEVHGARRQEPTQVQSILQAGLTRGEHLQPA